MSFGLLPVLALCLLASNVEAGVHRLQSKQVLFQTAKREFNTVCAKLMCSSESKIGAQRSSLSTWVSERLCVGPVFPCTLRKPRLKLQPGFCRDEYSLP